MTNPNQSNQQSSSRNQQSSGGSQQGSGGQQQSGGQQGQQGSSQKRSGAQGSGSSSSSSGSGKIDNVLYDVITVLHEKSKGLEAYEKYEQDLQGREEIKSIFDEIRRSDEQAVQKLRDCLKELVGQGSKSGEEAA